MKQNNNKRNAKKQGSPRVSRNLRVLQRAIQLADAFAPGAASAKFPDGSGRNTATAQLVHRVAVSSDAAGYAFIAAGGALDSSLYLSSTVTSGAVSLGSATDHDKQSGFAALALAYRITSFGMRFVPTASSDTDGGLMHIGSTDDIPSNFSELWEEPGFPMRLGGVVSATPLGSAARQFVGPTDTDAGDWSWCWLAIEGASASAQLGYLDIVYNVEYTIKRGGAGDLVKHEDVPPYAANVVSATSTVASSMAPMSIDGHGSFLSDYGLLPLGIGAIGGAAGAMTTVLSGMAAARRYVQSYQAYPNAGMTRP